MCNRLQLLYPALGIALLACGGGDLTLPVDGSPVALSVVSGDRQEALVGSEVPDPLVVLLTDATSQPVPGIPVIFSFQTEVPDAALIPTTVLTDSTGTASARVRLGTTAGPQTVEARVSELSTTFGLTALAQENPGRDGRGGKGGRDKDHGHGDGHGGEDD